MTNMTPYKPTWADEVAACLKAALSTGDITIAEAKRIYANKIR